MRYVIDRSGNLTPDVPLEYISNGDLGRRAILQVTGYRGPKDGDVKEIHGEVSDWIDNERGWFHPLDVSHFGTGLSLDALVNDSDGVRVVFRGEK